MLRPRAAMIGSTMPLVLGSASPRRKDILSGLGIPIRVEPADIPEHALPGELPLDYVQRIVAEKLAAVAVRVRGPLSAVLVADTVVVIDGAILGKPEGVAGAVRLLERI